MFLFYYPKLFSNTEWLKKIEVLELNKIYTLGELSRHQELVDYTSMRFKLARGKKFSKP